MTTRVARHLALDVLGDDQQQLAGRHDLLEHEDGSWTEPILPLTNWHVQFLEHASWRSASVTKYGGR